MNHLLKKEKEIRNAMLAGDEKVIIAVKRMCLRLVEEDRFSNLKNGQLFVFIYYYGHSSPTSFTTNCHVGDRSAYRCRKDFIIWIELLLKYRK